MMLPDAGNEGVLACHVGLKAGPRDHGGFIVPEAVGLAVVFRGGDH